MALTNLLLSFFSISLYIGIIYATVPFKTINIGSMIKYLFYGFLSIPIIYTINYFLPTNAILTPFIKNSFVGVSDAFIIYNYFLVALPEEFSKFISFRISSSLFKKANSSIISPMIYGGINALGFALFENITYVAKINSPLDVTVTRFFTATLMHLYTGFIIGYFIQLGKIQTRKFNRSLFDIYCFKHPKLKSISYTLMGIICAILLHGTHNMLCYSASIPGVAIMVIEYVLLAFGIKLMVQDLIRKKRLEYNEV